MNFTIYNHYVKSCETLFTCFTEDTENILKISEHVLNISQFRLQDVFAENDAAVTVVLFP